MAPTPPPDEFHPLRLGDAIQTLAGLRAAELLKAQRAAEEVERAMRLHAAPLAEMEVESIHACNAAHLDLGIKALQQLRDQKLAEQPDRVAA